MELLQTELCRAGVRQEIEYPLCRHSSFRIGGNARLALFPKNREEMVMCLCALRQSQLPYLIIGNASNVVFSDSGFDGVVLFTTAYREIVQVGEKMIAGAGAMLSSIASSAASASLTGMEFAQGIPGTLGGAVFMNAGAYDGCMEDVCTFSEYYDTKTGKVGILEGDAQEFGIRSSIYQRHPEYIVLSATFVLPYKEMRLITERINTFSKRRRASQPLDMPSAGSVFKRPIGYFAGKLIEECGLKGFSIGGAQVSEKHAGFIVNRGGATASDVKALMELIRETVYQRTGVTLEPEIRFV